MNDRPTDPSTAPDWERLDPRMLLVGPVQAVRGFLFPALIAAIGFGNQDLTRGLVIAGITMVISLIVGVIPWLTTTYRITGSALVVRTGLLKRQTLTAPLERIRSVDLEASLLHRLFALRKVKVGTGVDDGAIELDSLGAASAEALHHRLLTLSAVPTPSKPPAAFAQPAQEAGPDEPAGRPEAPAAAPPRPAQVLAAFDPGWARLAPFSLGPLAVAAGALGAASQLDLPFLSTGEALWDWLLRFSISTVVLAIVAAGLLAWCALTMVGYLVQWWDLRLVRDHGNLRLTRGLLTTTSTTVEEARVRGIELKEPVLLRAVNGAKLNALVTGLENGTYGVLPQVPRQVACGVASDILRSDPAAPLSTTLRQHGAAAHRRALIRGARDWVLPVVVVVATLWWFDQISWPWGLIAVLAALLWGLFAGAQSYRNLGHALTGEHLVVGAASLTRTRTVLERDGIIGWVLAATWFQRRVGVVTLTATTAAGSESVVLVDVPRAEAEGLVRALTPEWR